MEFWSYYRAFRRRRWVYIGAVLAALVVGAVLIRPDIGAYEASATLSIPSAQPALLIFGSQDQPGEGVRAALTLNLLQSRDLADRVIQRYQLRDSADEIQRRLRFRQEPGGRLVQVVATERTPAEAMTLANDAAEEATIYDEEVQTRESTLAREFIQNQADTARNNLRDAEDALLVFKQKNEFALASGTEPEVASLTSDSQGVDFSLREVEAKLAAVSAQMTGQMPTRVDQEITANPEAAQLRSQLVGLEVALASQLSIRTERYPEVVSLRAKIQAIKDRLGTEVAKIVSGEKVQHNPVYDALTQQRIALETERVALLAKRDALTQALSAVHQNLPGLAEVQLEQSRLQRHVDILAKEYGGLQTRLGQARLREQGVLDLGSLTVVDHARTAQPVPFQGTLVHLSLAAVLGLLAGAGLAYFLDYLDNGLNTPENAERLLGVPALAAIPKHNPPFEEAYRLLQATLATQMGGRGKSRILAVTSPRPKAGTSTVVTHLARVFARAGWRTLVIDAGLHQPVQHVAFGVGNDVGLAHVLAEDVSLSDAVVRTDTPNLSILPAGTAASKVNGMLGFPTFARALANLRAQFEVILLDTPPVGGFADALRVAQSASGVLLALDARQAPRGVETRSLAALGRAGAKVLGVVLTKVRPDLVDSYVYQDRFYHHPAARRSLVPAVAAAAALAGMAILFAWLNAHPGAGVGTSWRDVATSLDHLRAEVRLIDIGAAFHRVATLVLRLRAEVHLPEFATSWYWHSDGI
jgi:polysaccharide biosynthesis transport protein